MAASNHFSALLPQANAADRKTIEAFLRELPTYIVAELAAAGCKIRPLGKRERYDAASPALKRLGIDVDLWPTPPAGLFVCEERTVYVRSRSRMTLAHELCHAIDLSLGGGVYLSSTSPEIRRLFTAATAFVTPYAASGIDEYAAESMRCWIAGYGIEVNDVASHWPKASRERLCRVDRGMHDFLAQVFREIADRHPVSTQLDLGLIA